jgi:TP901 family phage tail tape measure protein
LIEGLKRSGSVAVASGVKFDELIGIISALQEKTSRGGAVIGNSLKTIFTRIQDVEKLKSLQNLGVQITDLEGRVLSSNKVIENLAPTFAKLDQATRVNLADNLVGKFQIAPFLALLEDYNLRISRSGEVANTSLNATSEAYQRNEALSQTLATAVNSGFG